MTDKTENLPVTVAAPGGSIALIHFCNGMLFAPAVIAGILPEFRYVELPEFKPAANSQDEFTIRSRRLAFVNYMLHFRDPETEPVLLKTDQVELESDYANFDDSSVFRAMPKADRNWISDRVAKMKHYLRQVEFRPAPRPALIQGAGQGGTQMGDVNAVATQPVQEAQVIDETKQARFTKRFKLCARKVAKMGKDEAYDNLIDLQRVLSRTHRGEDDTMLTNDLEKINGLLADAGQCIIATY